MTSDLARFLGFAFANADLLIEVDSQGTIAFATGAVHSLLGSQDCDLIGQSLERIIAPGDRGLVRRTLRTVGPNARVETRMVELARGSDRRSARLAGFRLGQSGNLQLTFTRADDQAASAAPSRRDEETGLLDTQAFQSQIAERFGLDLATGGPKLTLIKIADFGEVKSRLGSDLTGRLLGEVGALLRVHAATDMLATRLAEDRFGVVHGADLDGAALSAEINAMGGELAPDGVPLHAENLTLDVASPGLNAKDAARVLLFTVKRFAEDDTADITTMQDAVKQLVDQTVARVTTLRSTLSENGVMLQFQPIVTLSTRDLHHYEALARFPNGAPGPTIAFAEQIGMVQDIDLMVCQKALDVLLADKGKRPLQVAVNMSAASLGSDLFVAAFQRLLRSHSSVRSRLLVEVTESTGLTDLPRAGRVLEDLRCDGHRVCLDDFGAGAASFPYLQALPMDFVKIDGSYVKRIGHCRDNAILRAMVGLCKELRVSVIAEMVETAEQAAQLVEWGFDLGQGWLFGRPTDAPAYENSPVVGPAKRRGAQDSWG